MLKRVFWAMVLKPWLRITLAVVLLIVGLAPVGAPILSDDTWRRMPQPATATAQPFIYRSTVGPDNKTHVARSDDGGQSWHNVAAIPQPAAQVETVRGDEQHVFARTVNALWRSDDGGMSWTQLTSLPSRPLSMAVAPKEAGMLLAGTESLGLQRSLDGGLTWQAVDPLGVSDGGAAPLGVTAVAINAEDARMVYVATGQWLGASHAMFSPLGIWMSVDGGQHWLQMEQARLGDVAVKQLRPEPGQPLAVTATDDTGIRKVAMAISPELLAKLDAPDATTRTAAARAIGLIGDVSAVPALLSHLHDPDVLAGDEVAGAIGRLGDVSVIPGLLKELNSGDEAIRSRTAYALGLLKADAATSRLGEMLLSDGPAAKRNAAEALAAIGTPQAMDALLAPLADAEMTPTRHAAMRGLETAGDRAVMPLAVALNSRDAAARRNSAEMLGWLKAAEAAPALANALADADTRVRSEAAWALGQVGTPEAQRALARALAGEQDVTVRQATQSALAQAQRATGERALPFGTALLNALAQVPMTRWTFTVLAALLAVLMLWLGPKRPQPQRV